MVKDPPSPWIVRAVTWAALTTASALLIVCAALLTLSALAWITAHVRG